MTAASDVGASASKGIRAELQRIVSSEAFDASERTGRSTKFHALVEGKGRPLHFVLTGGHVHDNQVGGQFLPAPRPAPAAADKAYNSRHARQLIFGPPPNVSLR